MRIKPYNIRKFYILLAFVGICVIIIGFFMKKLNSDISSIFLSAGSIFAGLGLSWWAEEYFKERDERLSVTDTLNKILTSVENLKNSERTPKEKDIQFFRDVPLYLYYATKINNTKYWNSTKLDFSDKSHLGRLLSKATIQNREKTEIIHYNIELFRTFIHDHIILVIRESGEKSRASICVLQPCHNEKKNIYGFLFHEDWSGEPALSSAVLSFKNDFKQKHVGWLSEDHGKELEFEWKNKYNKDKYMNF